MAASGIAEHDEARRRERSYLRKAYLQTQGVKPKQGPYTEQRPEPDSQKYFEGRNYEHGISTTYSDEMRYLEKMGKTVAHDSRSVDRQRREAHYKQSKEEYSAKLPNRYTSIDYMSQW